MTVARVVASGVKLPPASIEAEEALLGGLLIDQDRLDEVIGVLKPEAFFHGPHAEVFGAMCAMRDQRRPIDGITLAEFLKTKGTFEKIGGSRTLSQLYERVPDPSTLLRYAEIIRDKSALRDLARFGHRLAEEADQDTAELDPLLDRMSRDFLQLLQQRSTQDYQSLDAVLDRVLEELVRRKESKTKYTGLRTGFHRLDELTLGFQPSDLIILAARPSVGKTSLAMNAAVNIAAEGAKVAVFSLEMSAEQLALRLLASRGRIDAQRLKRGDVSHQEFENAYAHLGNYPIFIDDTPGISPLELRAKCRMLQQRHGLDFVVVDYLQLMQGPNMKRSDSRVQEISEISRALKGIARELKVPVLALSQLSRAVESRTDKRPQLSDLRESGAIEQDADIVMFLWRKEDPESKHGPSPASLDEFRETAEVILMVAKHRNGPTGDIHLTFEKRFTNFAETMVGGGHRPEWEEGY